MLAAITSGRVLAAAPPGLSIAAAASQPANVAAAALQENALPAFCSGGSAPSGKAIATARSSATACAVAVLTAAQQLPVHDVHWLAQASSTASAPSSAGLGERQTAQRRRQLVPVDGSPTSGLHRPRKRPADWAAVQARGPRGELGAGVAVFDEFARVEAPAIAAVAVPPVWRQAAVDEDVAIELDIDQACEDKENVAPAAQSALGQVEQPSREVESGVAAEGATIPNGQTLASLNGEWLPTGRSHHVGGMLLELTIPDIFLREAEADLILQEVTPDADDVEPEFWSEFLAEKLEERIRQNADGKYDFVIYEDPVF